MAGYLACDNTEGKIREARGKNKTLYLVIICEDMHLNTSHPNIAHAFVKKFP